MVGFAMDGHTLSPQAISKYIDRMLEMDCIFMIVLE